MKLIIAELRKRKGVTQELLAQHLGVSFQAVSKWENNITMPEITLLPEIADYFEVSIDQLLGVKPLENDDYKSRDTNKSQYWDNKVEYLKDSRVGMWNRDYLKFLVDYVWKIDSPIDVIDVGCGYGYLGEMLLPLLPVGSTYTGMDISVSLIKQAEKHFKDSEYKTRFLNADINTLCSNQKYDLVICQALLRHVSNPKKILEKMIKLVTKGGLVVCSEVNREIENVGLFIEGIPYNPEDRLLGLKKLWQTELEKEGRDYCIGMRLPMYMQQCGLKQVGVRMNDCINFISPYSDEKEYKKALNYIIKAHGWGREIVDADKEATTDLFVNRGAERKEARAYIQFEEEVSNYIKGKKDISILKSSGLIISWGQSG